MATFVRSIGTLQSDRGHQDDGQNFGTNVWSLFRNTEHLLSPMGLNLALPGSVLTPSICARPDLNHPILDKDQGDPIFFENRFRTGNFSTPFGSSFTPLELKIWPRDYHRKIRHEKLRRIHLRDFVFFWTLSEPLLPPSSSKSDLGTIIERSGTKSYVGFIKETSKTDLWTPFYDQVSDYCRTHFWLYHPGDPNHSGFWLCCSANSRRKCQRWPAAQLCEGCGLRQ